MGALATRTRSGSKPSETRSWRSCATRRAGVVAASKYEGTESSLWTLRDGKVVRYEWFHGPDDAFKAVS